MDIEKTLQTTDFSQYSKVKESLRLKLLSQQDNELSMDELDNVTAAYSLYRPQRFSKTKNK